MTISIYDSARSRVPHMLSALDKAAQQSRSRRRGAQDRPRRLRQRPARARHAAADAPDSDHDGRRPRRRGAASRTESPKWADDEKTFADLHARVAKTIAHLKTFKPEQFDGAEKRAIEHEVSERDVQLHGQGLLAELRDPELLLPLHDGLRDPAPQRRSDCKGDFLGNRWHRAAIC